MLSGQKRVLAGRGRLLVSPARHVTTKRTILLARPATFPPTPTTARMQAARGAVFQVLRSRVALSQARSALPSISRSCVPRRLFSHGAGRWATSTTPHSSYTDPAVEESQRQLELGTVALEAGNIADAKVSCHELWLHAETDGRPCRAHTCGRLRYSSRLQRTSTWACATTMKRTRTGQSSRGSRRSGYRRTPLMHTRTWPVPM